VKRMLFTLVFAFGCVFMGFSDWFFGGDLSIQPDSRLVGSTIEISPTIGFIINNKIDWGINAYLGDNPPVIGNNAYWENYSATGIGVFGRFSFFEINNFSILGQCGLNYTASSGEYYNTQSGWEQYYYNISVISLSIKPVLQYKLLDRIYLYTGIGRIFDVSYSWSEDDIYTGFNFNFSTNGISISLSDISIGFYIKFGHKKNKQENDSVEIKKEETEKVDENEWW